MGGKETEEHMDTYSELNNYIGHMSNMKVSQVVAGRGLNEVRVGSPARCTEIRIRNFCPAFLSFACFRSKTHSPTASYHR